MRRIILFVIICFAFSLTGLFAIEFGGLAIGEFNAEGQEETDISGSVILAPWLSVLFTNAELYFSAGLNMSFAKESVFAPELYRLEYAMRISPLVSFRVGRIAWEDPSGMVAKGRFDGADFLFDLGKIRLGVNALYTGFLFKDTADINVSPADTKDYSVNLDWRDFGGTYFAPRRLLASVYGEFPGLPAERGHLYAGITAQFDLSGAGEAYHTQYILLRHTFIFKAFDLDASGTAGLEYTKADGVKPVFAFMVEGGWQPPSAIKDRVSLGIAWASGDGSFTSAFFPVTREAHGYALKPLLSGMMIIKTKYEAMILPVLSAEAGASYFIRTDSTSFTMPHLENTSYALGAEFDGGVVWAPFSDLTFSLKGGVFIPKTGTAWDNSAPVLWRVTAGAIVSF